MADSTRDLFARVPANASPDELHALLGEPEPREPISAERAADLEAFGLAATELQRINLELVEVASGTQAFWNADDFAQGAVDESLRGSGVVPAEFGAELSRAALALLAAAETDVSRFTILLRTSLNDPPAGQLVIEWLERHEPAVQSVSLAEAAETPLAAEVAALCAVLESAGTAVQGRLSIRTFGLDPE